MGNAVNINTRVGFGYDLHKLIKKRKLMLGGMEIPSKVGEDGYSDGDVLIHAIIDAMLGALCKGDIGTHFPTGNKEYKDISSRILLKKTAQLLKEEGCRIVNIDSTVILQRPKLVPYIGKIKQKLSNVLELGVEHISVKAKTGEGIGLVGKCRAIEAYAVVLVQRI